MNHRRRRRKFLSIESSNSNICLEDITPEIKAYCQKWTLRALVDLGGYKNILEDDHCTDPNLIFSLDLGFTSKDEYDYKLVLSALKAKHREIIAKELPDLPNTNLVKNINWLAKEVSLSFVECKILMFCVLERQHVFLRQTMASLGEMSTGRAVTTLSVILEIPPQEIYKAFDSNSTLIRSGLISIDENNIFDFANKIELINGITERINSEQDNPFDIFADNFLVSQQADLDLENFEYLGAKVTYLAKYLKQVVSSGKKGANILLYGVPGSGKTQLARAVAKKIGANLFEVAVEDRDGDRINGTNRLSAYRLSQRVLSKRTGSLIVFDEIEDIDVATQVDDSGFSSKRGNRTGHKGWMNQLLESNLVPAIWITNNVRFLDPAHLRRFDMHIHVDIPPIGVRTSMLSELTKELNIAPDWCHSMAANESLTPALISRSTKVAGVIYATCQGVAAETILDSVVGSALRVQNQSYTRMSNASTKVSYDVNCINADCDLEQLIKGLGQSNEGRICLYGPPGTGKSAFAQHAAKLLGKTVLLKRASDILGPFVGETESRMAAMFNEAIEKDAVLILDEADTFLRSRESAQRSWEMTMVNEMLTQMESFQGIFFCTTNLIDHLDEASMRRFDMKINFQFIKRHQAVKMFEDLCQKLNFTCDDLSLRAFSQIGKLTPGDFANVLRQSRFNPTKDAMGLVHRLKSENALKKNGVFQSMGFLANAA